MNQTPAQRILILAQQESGRDAVYPHEKLDDVFSDSLDRLEFLLRVQDEFKVEVREEDCPRLTDVVAAVERRAA